VTSSLRTPDPPHGDAVIVARWGRRRALGPNRYSPGEFAGAFGDLGTLIPFVAGYIAVTGIDPFGILLTLGLTQILVGMYFRTPMAVQPMKAIAGAAIAAGGAVTPGMVFGAGVFTGLFWLLAGVTRTVSLVSALAAKPVVRGILLGLGLRFVTEGISMMLVTPWLGGLGLVLTLALLTRPLVPPMVALLVVGTVAGYAVAPEQFTALLAIPPSLHLPTPTFGRVSWHELVMGSFVLAIPQLPLTLGNAVIAIRTENNDLFPRLAVSDRMLATSQGLINLAAVPLGGVPLCHGAGGMAGHVRFGARTGGALVMFGVLLLALAVFFSHSVSALFQIFPRAVLGVILFFAGLELAVTSRDIGSRKEDVYVMLATAGFAMWNMGAALLVGVILHQALTRGWLKL